MATFALLSKPEEPLLADGDWFGRVVEVVGAAKVLVAVVVEVNVVEGGGCSVEEVGGTDVEDGVSVEVSGGGCCCEVDVVGGAELELVEVSGGGDEGGELDDGGGGGGGGVGVVLGLPGGSPGGVGVVVPPGGGLAVPGLPGGGWLVPPLGGFSEPGCPLPGGGGGLTPGVEPGWSAIVGVPGFRVTNCLRWTFMLAACFRVAECNAMYDDVEEKQKWK